MRRRENREILPFDPEIDRTYHTRQQEQRRGRLLPGLILVENPLFEDPMAEQNPNAAVVNGAGNEDGNGVNQEHHDEGGNDHQNRGRTLIKDVRPDDMTEESSVIRIPVEANNFVLSPQLLSMVKQDAFSGSQASDPHAHIRQFLQICGTMKMNGVGQEAIRLLLFPFSLRDGALEWLHSLPEGSITTWTELYNQFLQEFFPYAKVRATQDQIDHFKQRHGESLYEAWRRFKAMLRKVPNRERPPVDRFFMGLLPSVMKEVNAAAGGAFMHQDRHDAWRF